MPRYTLPDYDLNVPLEWSEDEMEFDPSACGLWRPSWFRALMLLWPVGCLQEAILAECVGQSLTAGLSEVESLQLAAGVFARHRIGESIREMADGVQAGHRILVALKKTGMRVSRGLLEAVRVGEDHGHLATELRAFARATAPDVCQRLVRFTGRSKRAIHFARTLGRLVQDHRLTTSVVRDAGHIVAGDDKRFRYIVEKIVIGMEDGDPFGKVLGRFPSHFDRMFVRFVDVSSSRADLRANLRLLTNDQTA